MNNKFEASTLLGVLLSFLLIITAAISGDTAPMAYFDINSVIIVFGGTFFVTSACYSISDTVRALGDSGQALFSKISDGKSLAISALQVAEIVKKDGLLKLQNRKDAYPAHNFFRKYMDMVVDGLAANEVHKLMDQEIATFVSRNNRTINILKKTAEIAPAMGLIGTLIGLVQMLGNLEDPSKIGPAMAIALLTTLYGAIISYVVALPISSKLERNSKYETEIMQLLKEAVVCLANNEGTLRLEMRLNSHLSPEDRFQTYK